MTTTDTLDTQATVLQAERLADAGCEIVRITAPSILDAQNLRPIRDELHRRGVRVPLVADIHFTPNAALAAAELVEKVRVNPGNYADKKKFEVREYTDAEYAAELERVAERFRPLVRRCKERGAAMRIGTNHGSLSDRIMNRYGDTPLGMVESALEFLDVCEDEGFRDVVFSMKASNAQVAIQAYRLLAPGSKSARRASRPTRSTSASPRRATREDGRIKSAIGIGALLEDGIGDTIRVSLTEDPVKEIPVARALARRAEARFARDVETATPGLSTEFCVDPYVHHRRQTDRMQTAADLGVGGEDPVRVELELGRVPARPAALAALVATSLGLHENLACEGLRLEVPDADALGAAGGLARELASLGVVVPLVLDVPVELASRAAATGGDLLGARIALPVAGTCRRTALAEAAAAAAARGRPLE